MPLCKSCPLMTIKSYQIKSSSGPTVAIPPSWMEGPPLFIAVYPLIRVSVYTVSDDLHCNVSIGCYACPCRCTHVLLDHSVCAEMIQY